ncbi:S66 peptidase family protein [Symbiobacterium terraclitae]|uniref:S66 peptidase family protein n=1 Tax=Symbiobacterium terraclitae TaxID=557451 RepID=UPI0035B507F7
MSGRTDRAPGPATSCGIVKPPRLRPGDLVGVVAPSGPVTSRRAEVEAGMRCLEEYGFRVREGEHLWAREGIRAGSREEQLADLHAMFSDPEVQAIFCATGGITAITLVDGLDYDLIARHPKAFIGMSDVTILQAALLSRAGLVSFHASGLAEGLGSPDAEREGPHLLRLLTDPEPPGPLPEWAGAVRLVRGSVDRAVRGSGDGAGRGRMGGPVQGGAGGVGHGRHEVHVSGRLVGGCWNCMLHLLGTPYWPPTDGAILFLEGVNLATSAVLRGLTQLRLAGALDGVAALLFGHMEGCFQDRPSPAEGLALAVEHALGDLDLPVCQTEAFGHCVPNVTLPVGAVAAIRDGRLVLEEGAVV